MTSPEHPVAPIIILQKVHKVDTLSNTNPRIEDVTHTLPTYIDVHSKERYVLWSDIQDACTGVSYVEDRPDRDYRRRMFFMVDENYQLYVSLSRIPIAALLNCKSNYSVCVVALFL